MLSLGLLLPFGAAMAPDRVARTVAAFVDPTPAKRITLVRDGAAQTFETRAATAEALLAEHGVFPAPSDALSVPPASPLVDGERIVYRAAVPVSLTVDGTTRLLRSPAASVGDLLARAGVTWDRHDDVSPPAATPLGNDLPIVVRHVSRWTEIVRRPLAPAVVKRWSMAVAAGSSQVVDPGDSGLLETVYRVQRTPDRRGVRRTELTSLVVRAPHDRVVAEGIAEFTALSELARRELVGTLGIATSALSMIATAYTADCRGCSGTTATGRAAGHGIVAVDPAVIPLGTHLFIPGYGRAVAGDTGGAIRGRRIDLGFDSRWQATQFGRRPLVVYVYK
jgi:3D (Asp-Asp-Asp) domain-containing protein/uncharacterized protein YabE (DUF348 family)